MASSCFSAHRQWLDFLDESLFEELNKPQPILVFSQEQAQLQQEFKQGSSSLRGESRQLGKVSRKRSRDAETTPKAVREKMRRDKLNDKFVELSYALDPKRPKTSVDKSAILIEVACIVQKLREEARRLHDSNNKLREALKDLKVEKNELRDEKLRLKGEKERLEEQLKTCSLSFVPHPAVYHEAAAAAAAQAFAAAHSQSLQASEAQYVSAFPMWQSVLPSSSTSATTDDGPRHQAQAFAAHQAQAFAALEALKLEYVSAFPMWQSMLPSSSTLATADDGLLRPPAA